MLYSGTVGAAMEGYLHDLHVAAISLDIDAGYPYALAAELVRPFLERAIAGADAPLFLNVNFPCELRSTEFAMSRLGRRDYENAFQQEIVRASYRKRKKRLKKKDMIRSHAQKKKKKKKL